MRQPCERSTSPNASRLMSWRSPGAQARSASGPPAATPEPREREQPAADEVAGEVLLADLERAPLPVVADLREGRQDHLPQDCLDAERREALVEHGVRAGLVVVRGSP